MLNELWRRIQAGRPIDDILRREHEKEHKHLAQEKRPLSLVVEKQVGHNKKVKIPIRFPLKVGRTYVAQKGEEVRIVGYDLNKYSTYPFRSSTRTYAVDGRWWAEGGGSSGHDLVEEILSLEEWEQLAEKQMEKEDTYKELILEVGKSYENREGRTVKIIKKVEAGVYEYIGDEGRRYTKYGRFVLNGDSPWDLIKEVQVEDTPKEQDSLDTTNEMKPNEEANSLTPSDNVNHPSHYTTGKIEAIDLIENALTAVEFRGMLIGNILKYILRFKHKNGTEDLKKARWYLNRLIDEKEEANG